MQDDHRRQFRPVRPARGEAQVTAARSLVELLEFDAIKLVKYTYIRCIDTKDWASLADVLTEDCVATWGSGKYTYNGRDVIVGFLASILGDREVLSSHRVQQPEITLHGDDTATVRWAVDDTVVMHRRGRTLRGSAYYTDRMVKVDGEWKIQATGYRRIFEEIEPRPAGIRLLDAWFDHDGDNE
jgi:ketosteroid isomerase-like protein